MDPHERSTIVLDEDLEDLDELDVGEGWGELDEEEFQDEPEDEVEQGELEDEEELEQQCHQLGKKAPEKSCKVRRLGGKRTHPRSMTIAMKRLTREEMRQGVRLAPYMEYCRPKMRHECLSTQRPCPFVSCKHHLYLDVNPETGSIKINFPHLNVWEMDETCALDVASRGGITLEEVGEILNLTRERIRQVEVRGLIKLKMTGGLDGIPSAS
jgi:hypothetical protein